MIDALNRFAVGIDGLRVVVLAPPQGPVSPDDALLLAAYLVAVAEPRATRPFADVLAAVKRVTVAPARVEYDPVQAFKRVDCVPFRPMIGRIGGPAG